MATFELQGPDGGTYQIDAPDAESAVAALHGGGSAPSGDAASSSSDPGFVANAARALRMGLPFGNQFVAAEKTVLPQSFGGSQGFDYGQNLADVNTADARLQQQHPVIADLGQGTGAALGALAVPAAALGEGAQGLGVIGRSTLGGLTGAGLGAVQGAGAPGSDIRNLPQTEEGAVGGLYAGGALGSFFPAAGAAIGSVFSKGAVDPTRQSLVDALREVGVKPTAGQVTGNQGLQKLEASISDIPFGGGGAEVPRQANAKVFTKAILAKAGFPEVADASPESLNAAHEALGAQFDALGGRNAIVPDAQFAADMTKAINDYHNVTGTPAAGISKFVEGINGTLMAGPPSPAVTATRPQAPTGPAPTPMLDFLRRAGGLKDEGGDLASMGFANLNGRAVKGSSKIIDKENGLPMDEARRMAVEAGYMEPHETVADFINKLGEHPTYSVHDEEAVAARAARDAYDTGPDAALEGEILPPAQTPTGRGRDIFGDLEGKERFDAEKKQIANDAHSLSDKDFQNKWGIPKLKPGTTIEGEHPTYSQHDEEAVAARAARDAYDTGPQEAQPFATGPQASFRANAAERAPEDFADTIKTLASSTAGRPEPEWIKELPADEREFEYLYHEYGQKYPDAGSPERFKERIASIHGLPQGTVDRLGLQTPTPSAPIAAQGSRPAPPRVILGEEYNNLRSQLGKTAQKLRFSDPAQAEAYRGVQDALDSAMERSIAATNPEDLGAFQAVRQKYKNLLPIEQAAGSAGADAASGIISPQQMRTALAAGGNRRSYARGIGDLAPLTNAGNAILTNFPQSGTAPRTMMAHALQGIGGLAGGLGGAPGGLESAGLGAAAGGLALPALVGRAVMSGPGQAILSRALAKRLPMPPPRPLSRAAMAAALAANADLQAQRNQATPQ